MLIRSHQSFENYQTILDRFGISVRDLNQLDNRIAIPLKQILADLNDAMRAFPHLGKDLSTHTLINWSSVLAGKRGNTDEILANLFSSAIRCANRTAKHAEFGMVVLYMLMNLAQLILNLVAFDLPYLDRDTINSQTGGALNYLNAIGGVLLALRYFQQGERRLGSVHLFNSGLLTGCTLAANSIKYGDAGQLSSAGISGLIGFSFAISIVIGAGMEYYQAHQCSQRITVLNSKLSALDLDQDQRFALQKMILIEKAQRANHIRSAKASAACATVMLITAIVIYLTLSGVNLGSIPVATIVLAVTAIITGFTRKFWVDHQDYVANAKKALTPPERAIAEQSKPPEMILPPFERKPSDNLEPNQALLENVAAIADIEPELPSLFARLQQSILNDPYKQADFLDRKLMIPGKCLFQAKSITLREYLTEMARKDPKKLEAIVMAMEKSDIENVKITLGQHRSCVISGGWGKTTGQYIAEQLFPKPSATPKRGQVAMVESGKPSSPIHIVVHGHTQDDGFNHTFSLEKSRTLSLP